MKSDDWSTDVPRAASAGAMIFSLLATLPKNFPTGEFFANYAVDRLKIRGVVLSAIEPSKRRTKWLS